MKHSRIEERIQNECEVERKIIDIFQQEFHQIDDAMNL
jgi:hypothetical protein